jgi:20S proteasome subunit alpha 2
MPKLSWKNGIWSRLLTNKFRYNDDIELEDAIHTAILTLKEGFEGEMTENNIEVGIVDSDKQFRVLSPEKLKYYISEVGH